MMDRRDLIKDLIGLSGKSPSRIAEDAGLSRSGVLRWLKGGSDLGEKAQEKLLLALGGFGGTLSPHIVHSWTLKSSEELVPLARVLSWATPVPFEMVYLVPGHFNFKMEELEGWGTEDNPLAIYDSEKKIRILFRRKLDPFNPNSEEIDSLVDSGRTVWRELHPLPLDLKIFKNCWNDKLSVEEYDRILGLGEGAHPEGKDSRRDSMTWEAFGQEMERRGLRAEDILEMIERGKEGKP